MIQRLCSMAGPQKNEKSDFHVIQQLHFGYVFERSESSSSKRYLYTHIHSSIICNRQKVEAIQASIDGGVDKQNVTHLPHRSLKGAWLPARGGSVGTGSELWPEQQSCLSVSL